MSIARRRTRMRRTQISLPNERYEAAVRIAAKRGVSLSQVFREGLQCVERQEQEQDREYLEGMLSIVGIVPDGDPRSSEEHDRILYGDEH